MFDAVRAGAFEELGVTDIVGEKILSIVMESSAGFVNVLAIIETPLVLKDVQANWDLKAQDGRKELKHLDHRSVNNYTITVSSILYFQRKTTGAALISS
jgi:hypothetical protein